METTSSDNCTSMPVLLNNRVGKIIIIMQQMNVINVKNVHLYTEYNFSLKFSIHFSR